MGRKYSDDMPQRKVRQNRPKKDSIDGFNAPSTQTEVFNEKNSNFMTAKLLEYTNEVETQPRLNYKNKKSKAFEMQEINSKEM